MADYYLYKSDNFLHFEKMNQNRQIFRNVKVEHHELIQTYISKYDFENSLLPLIIKHRENLDEIKPEIYNYLIRRKIYLDKLVKNLYN